MYKVKIFFGSFYGEWFENDFLEDMDWSDISVAECMIEAHFPVVPAHGSFVDVSNLRSQIYKGWKKGSVNRTVSRLCFLFFASYLCADFISAYK